MEGHTLSRSKKQFHKATTITQRAHATLNLLIEEKVARHQPNGNRGFVVEGIGCTPIFEVQRIGYLADRLTNLGH